ncbi:MAG: pyruvate, phosphate dikinase [Planctomycetaceae bacterium]|jgi:pyruvate,orthophosphate dikinase|nr:pyruvate, phosphate dikinase [Planctomycetaceae bacterium]
MAKYVYSFGPNGTDGDATMKNLLGGKGANLAEMAKIGLPVPAGFTISTEVCTYYYANGNTYPPELAAQVETALAQIEKAMGKTFGDKKDLPLLVSCRSGARESMPGMMDTVLNIGLNDETVKVLADKSGDERFAWDCYRRFVQMYGDVVLEMKPTSKTDIDPFEEILERKKHQAGVKNDPDLKPEHLKELVAEFKAAVKTRTGRDFPEDPREQMWGAIGAVFGSWMNDRAIVYRRMNSIPHDWGTAVNVQAMVFGNMGNDCATGVALTRNGANGEPGITGDYLINAQGEDVVAGIRVPKKIETTLKDDMPKSWEEFSKVAMLLENHYKDIQDIEFTIERQKLWMLQTRNAKRTGFAAVRAAVDMVNEGLISPETAIARIPANDITQLLQPVFSGAGLKGKTPIAKGINAGPGAATGQICFQPDEAEALWQKDNHAQIILVRRETTPEDLRGMKVAKGIVTSFGGAASHAALVSRQMGKACVCGCDSIVIDYKTETLTVGGTVLKKGDWISVDGFTGNIYAGQVPTSPSEVLQVLFTRELKPQDAPLYQRFQQIMSWSDRFRKLGVRTNADNPTEANNAIALGAEGIGLTRTEHMFFDHIDDFRKMILSETVADREKALEPLLAHQRADFEGIFRAMAGRPVTVRLLDPPLHEFVPHEAKEQEDLARKMGVSTQQIANRVHELAESNPMLGHRGCRLGIVYPEITRMQARAITEAATNVMREGINVHPEIMIPLVGNITEFRNQEAIIRETAAKVFKEKGITVDYLVGTMIEIPRAAITADEIAQGAEFFSFGTNDLTQTGLGISRDDYGAFINDYQEKDIFPADPFQTLDQGGVGKLMKLGIKLGRSTREDIKLGICGEHGGDPASVKFCHEIGLNYVSCSPLRLPVARLAAAQAAIAEKKAKKEKKACCCDSQCGCSSDCQCGCQSGKSCSCCK